jgi:hypothetical protein
VTRAAFIAAVVLALAACSDRKMRVVSPEPHAASAMVVSEPEPVALTLPAMDMPALRAALTPDETLEAPEFDAEGSMTVSGAVEGYKAKVWAVPVASGQTLTVTFEPSNADLYFNVMDAKVQGGEAVFAGEIGGNIARLVTTEGTTYLLKPFQPLAMARRGEKGEYRIVIERR